MDPQAIYNKTNTLAKACLKVAMVLPHDQQMAAFARVELVRHASDLGVKTRGLMVGQLGEVFVERLSRAVDSCNGCGFWLQLIIDDGILNKPEIISPLVKECDTLSAMFLAALKTAKNKMD
ncbi:MAG: hypothetical protein KC517_02110 [Bacteroidetes bacterium]|jgi:hypothetical protein|nr:hypothetical protein [Bacteroidota bacterium]